MARCYICNKVETKQVNPFVSETGEETVTDDVFDDQPIMDRSPLFRQELRNPSSGMHRDKRTGEYICGECKRSSDAALAEMKYWDKILKDEGLGPLEFEGEDALDHAVSLDEVLEAEERLVNEPIVEGYFRYGPPDHRPIRVQISPGGYRKIPRFEE